MPRPFIPVIDTAVIDFNQSIGGINFCNSFYFYSWSGAWTLERLVALLGECNNWYINHYLPLQSFDIAYLGCKGTDLTTEDGISFTLPVSGYVGGQTMKSMPINTAIYIKSSPTRKAGDAYYYWVAAGFPIDAVVGNEVEQEYLDALREAFIRLQDVEPGFGVDAVHVSYKQGGEWRTEGLIRAFGFTYPIKRRIGTRARRPRNKPIT